MVSNKLTSWKKKQKKQKKRLFMVSLKMDLISIRNTQLMGCDNILAIQYQLFDDHRTPASQAGVVGGGVPRRSVS